MSSYDTFRFSKKFPQFPAELPGDQWYTKDMDCNLHEYWVNAQGQVARKNCGEDEYFFNPNATFSIWVRRLMEGNSIHLKVTVSKGYIQSIRREPGLDGEEDDESDRWDTPVPGPDED